MRHPDNILILQGPHDNSSPTSPTSPSIREPPSTRSTLPEIMSVVAFTFGSLGDIITLLQLADHVRKALYDTKGASAEYRDVISDLDSIVYTVTEVQRTLSLPGPDRLCQSVENALYHAMGICLHLIAQMNERIAARRAASRNGKSIGAMAIDAWQRIGWTLFKKEELLVLRRRMSAQIEAMNTLLVLAQGDRMNHVNKQVARISNEVACLREESREPCMLIREIHRCVTNLPHNLGYVWEGKPGTGNKPITFTDILGQTMVLPWDLVATEQLLHELLLFYFRDHPYLGIIRTWSYIILNSHGHLRVSFPTCNAALGSSDSRMRNHDYEPGSRLDMRMDVIIRTNFIPGIQPPGRPNVSIGRLQILGPTGKMFRSTPNTERLSSDVPRAATEAIDTMARTTHEINNAGETIVWRFPHRVPPSILDGCNGSLEGKCKSHRGWQTQQSGSIDLMIRTRSSEHHGIDLMDESPRSGFIHSKTA